MNQKLIEWQKRTVIRTDSIPPLRKEPLYNLLPGERIIRIGERTNSEDFNTSEFNPPIQYIGAALIESLDYKQRFLFLIDSVEPSLFNPSRIYILIGKRDNYLFEDVNLTHRKKRRYQRVYKPVFTKTIL